MLTFLDSRRPTRRDFLTVGSLAGMSLPALLAGKGSASERSVATGKSVIFLMMHGGPSQLETFDPKPDGPPSSKPAGGVVQTNVPGTLFGRSFPRLAERADKLAIVRNFTPENGNHDIKPVVSPYSLGANLGSFVSRIAGPLRENGMPTNAAVFPNSVDASGPGPRNNFGNFLSTGALGASYAPFVPGAAGPVQQNMRLNVARERLDDRRALLAQVDGLRRQIDAAGTLAAADRLQAQAYDVILSGVAQAFDLRREDPRLVARYDTARHERPNDWAHKNNRNNYSAHAKSLGKLLLLARRMCEAGCGFVTVNTEFVWDMHQDVNNLGVGEGMPLVGTPFDHAVAAFIDDVEARGLSDQIMLVATGEMGRTPTAQGSGGRNHWGRLAPLLVYGGGVGRGQLAGRSTRDGGEPAENPQRINNLIATIMQTMFNVGDVRLMPGMPADVLRVVTESAPIPGLLA